LMGTAKDYQPILEDHVCPMVQTLFPEGVDEHKSEAEHLP